MKGKFLYNYVYAYYVWMCAYPSCRFQCVQLGPSVMNFKLTPHTMFLENSYWMISLDLVLLDLHLIPNFFILLDLAFPIPYLSIPFGYWVFAVD